MVALGIITQTLETPLNVDGTSSQNVWHHEPYFLPLFRGPGDHVDSTRTGWVLSSFKVSFEMLHRLRTLTSQFRENKIP